LVMQIFLKVIGGVAILFVSILSGFSQNVGINTGGTAPHPSAALDIESLTGGLLIPRLTTVQRNAIVAPATSLLIYNTDTDCLEMYFASGMWKSVQCGCFSAPANPQSITGSQTVCPGAIVTYSTALIPDAVNYTWTVDAQDTLASGAGTNSITVSFSSNPGIRTISVQAGNGCGSSSAFSFQVNVSPINATFSPLNGNLNQPVAFTAGAYAGASYAWSFAQGNPATSTISSPSVTWSSPGSYSVSLTITDAQGCSATQTDNIAISPCTPTQYSFGTCTQIGVNGPSQSLCNSFYSSGNLNGLVSVSGNGVQNWTVPLTSIYRIVAAGAQGGSSSTMSGGGGAIVAGEITLNAGDVIQIVIGQVGNLGPNGNGGGGGGGSYVIRNNQPLLVAGGGGGGSTYGSAMNDGFPGNTFTQGSGNLGGTNGNGGGASSGTGGSGGGGFLSDGLTNGYGSPGLGWPNGSLGGAGYNSTSQGWGGFGGGGGYGFSAGGGGGGYSGGGGGRNAAATASGGGGSFIDPAASNVATSNGQYNGSTNLNGSIQNLASYRMGDGYVTITRVCP
jgi:hypothetical protein